MRTPLKSFIYGLLYKLPLPPSSLHNHILYQSTRPFISTHKVPQPSLIRSLTSISSAQFSIYVSIANNFLTVVYRPENSLFRLQNSLFRPQNSFFVRRTPFIVRQAGYISTFVPSSPKKSISQRTFFHPPDDHLKRKRKNSFRSINPLPPRHSQWPYLKLDSFIQERRAMRTMAIFPGVSSSSASPTQNSFLRV